jgi:ubiquinone/menaquinone biosynthesis C-methylase UbiE
VITSGSKTYFKAGSFDSLFAIEVLEHLDDLNAGIKEIKRILGENGIVYITFMKTMSDHNPGYPFHEF